LAIRVARKLKAIDVIDVLSDLFILRGVPAHIRSDNGPEFVAKAVQEWIAAVGAKTAYIERGSPWENGYIESFNARLRDELLNGEIFYTLREAQIVIEMILIWGRSRRASGSPMWPASLPTSRTRNSIAASCARACRTIGTGSIPTRGIARSASGTRSACHEAWGAAAADRVR
jgi:transposase InsO family protein